MAHNKTVSLFFEDFSSIGYVSKTFKTEGYLRFVIEERYIDIFENQTHVFLLLNNQHIPFRIESSSLSKGLIKLKNIDTLEDAARYSNKEIFVPDYLVSHISEVEDKSDYEFLVGYMAYNDEIEIGIIVEVSEMPGQYMATIKYKGKDCLVPIHENLISDISQESKKIIFNLPEGILDL